MSNFGYADPWVSGFGGRGVPTYVECRDGQAQPRAVLPSLASVGGMRGVAEWFSIAASVAGAGLRPTVSDEQMAAHSPASTVRSLDEEKQEVIPQAYSQPMSALQAALGEFSSATAARGLPDERKDSAVGVCYLEVIRREFADRARRELGEWPTLSQLACLPESYFVARTDSLGVGVVVRGDSLHFQKGGGDGHVTAWDLIMAARMTLMRARNGRAGLAPLLLSTKVGGYLPCTEPEVSPVDNVVVAARGREAAAPPVLAGDSYPSGYCYLQAFKTEHVAAISQRLGANPRMAAVAGLPAAQRRPPESLRRLFVVECAEGLHFTRDMLLGMTAELLFHCLDSGTAQHVLDWPVGARELCEVCRDAGQPVCFVKALRVAWGNNIAVEPGEDREKVFPRARFSSLPAVRKTVRYRVVGTGCIVPDAGGGTLLELLPELYADRFRVLPVGFYGPVFHPCVFCPYSMTPGHSGRCRAVGSEHGWSELDKRRAWLGDARHALDVREAVVRFEVVMAEATIVSQWYLSGASQAKYVRKRCGVGPMRSDKWCSTWFEAHYDELRQEYLLWLEDDLPRLLEEKFPSVY